MKINGIPLVYVIRSKMFPAVPVLLAPCGKENELVSTDKMLRICGMTSLALLAFFIAGAHFQSSIVLFFLAVAVFLIFYVIIVINLIEAVQNIDMICKLLNRRGITPVKFLTLGSIEEIKAFLSEQLQLIADDVVLLQHCEPGQEKEKACTEYFRILHRSAQCLKMDFGSFKPFFDNARAKIEKMTTDETAKLAMKFVAG